MIKSLALEFTQNLSQLEMLRVALKTIFTTVIIFLSSRYLNYESSSEFPLEIMCYGGRRGPAAPGWEGMIKILS